jgi:hypothetical protein
MDCGAVCPRARSKRVRAAQKSKRFKRFKRINRAVLAARRRTPERKNASVDAKLLRPIVDTALIEKMSIAGRMLETRAAALSHCT